MKKTLSIAIITAIVVLANVLCASTVFADSSVVYYFIDCGDYLVDTVSEGDSFGSLNSVTDQFFGEDPSTGMEWGVVDEAYNKESSLANGDTRVNTTWTWAFDYNVAATDVAKEESTRYCHDMYENGIDRVMTYKFELPEDGEYTIEIGFANPWGNSSSATVYLNGEIAQELTGIGQNSYVTFNGNASPAYGFITVEARSDDATIHMTYITISKEKSVENTEDSSADEPADDNEPTEAESTPIQEKSPDTGVAFALLPAVTALIVCKIFRRK